MHTEPVHIVPYQPEYRTAWQSFLAVSDNGTVFHDLDFLAYHPPGRFAERHLLFYQGEKLVGLLPAAVVQEANGLYWLKSPYGASVGGLVLPVRQSLLVTLALIEALKTYTVASWLAGVEMRLGPPIYNRVPQEGLSFALAASGFRLTQRWLTMVIPLGSNPAQILETIPNKRRRTYIRAALGRGLEVHTAAPVELPAFYKVLEANRARHHATPTHSLAELETLLTRKPDAIRLFTCTLAGQIIGGTVIFELNNRVAYSFYPCHDEAFEAYRPPTVVLLRILEEYTRRRFRYLDLGPTGNIELSHMGFTLNAGGAFFKHGMGGVGYCRDTWRWQAGTTPA